MGWAPVCVGWMPVRSVPGVGRGGFSVPSRWARRPDLGGVKTGGCSVVRGA